MKPTSVIIIALIVLNVAVFSVTSKKNNNSSTKGLCVPNIIDIVSNLDNHFPALSTSSSY